LSKPPVVEPPVVEPPVVEPPAVEPEKKTKHQRKQPLSLAFERDTKRRRKQQTAECDRPYDVELHIPKQPMQKG